jgi:threonine synthase
MNPTGTFKDREASFVISKAKENGLNKIVFHSTGNTGRAYAVYAKETDIESFFFLPSSCMDKCDSKMISDKVHIIAVDGHFNKVSSVAKHFAKKNNLVVLAPLHDKLEGKATIAYDQYQELPEATMFVQTIAGGYGVIGFFAGYQRLKSLGMCPKDYKVPRIVIVQPEDNCTIINGMIVGKEKLTEKDLILPPNPFEKTLQSTNPLKTFSEVKECIDQTDGLFSIAGIKEIVELKNIFESSLKSHGILVSFENEKSPYISFAGLVKLAKENKITKDDVLYLVITGRGCTGRINLEPEAVLKPNTSGYDIISSSDYMKELL